MFDCHVPTSAMTLWVALAVLPTVLNGWLIGRRAWENHTTFVQAIIVGFAIVAVIYATGFMLYVYGCREGVISILMCIFCYLLPISVAIPFWGFGREQAAQLQRV